MNNAIAVTAPSTLVATLLYPLYPIFLWKLFTLFLEKMGILQKSK